jgi:hypothetical protein
MKISVQKLAIVSSVVAISLVTRLYGDGTGGQAPCLQYGGGSSCAKQLPYAWTGAGTTYDQGSLCGYDTTDQKICGVPSTVNSNE